MGKAKYGVGVFGIGWVSGEHIKAYIANPLTEVKALASRSRESAEAKKQELGLDCDVLDSYDELLKRDDIDIISMCSPNFLRAEEIIKACEAGKHFMAEKPICHNLDELKEIKKAYKKAYAKGIKGAAGHCLQYNPMVESIKSMIRRDALGKIFFVETDYWHEIGPWWHGWTWGCYTKKNGPSVELLGAIHSFGTLVLFGGDVDEITSYGCRGHRKEFEYEPTFVSIVKFKNGAVGRTGGSFEIESPYVFNIILHGSKGTVINNRFYTRDVFAGQEGWQIFASVNPDSGEVTHHPFPPLINDFVNDIEGNGPAEASLDFSFKAHEAAIAAQISRESGKTVKLPLLK